MCGRYAVTLPPEAVRAFFSYVEQPNFPPRYNIAPTQPIPIVQRGFTGTDRDARHFRLVRWGFVPGFVKDFASFRPLVNARSEGIAEKASFRNAFRRRRCLVVADAFYEWFRLEKNPPRPFMARRRDGAPFGMAGLTETWMGGDGSELDTACIITTAATGAFAAIHERMPVVIDPADFDLWLDLDERRAGEAEALLQRRSVDGFELIPIGPAVNKVANDDPSIQLPVDDPVQPSAAPRRAAEGGVQGSLF